MVNFPYCEYCKSNRNDTVEHHFFLCETATKFWKELQIWISQVLSITFNFTICEILFGIPFDNDTTLYIINILMMHGKYFLNNRKSYNKAIVFSVFVMELKYKMQALCNLCINEGTKNKTSKVVSELNSILRL